MAYQQFLPVIVVSIFTAAFPGYSCLICEDVVSPDEQALEQLVEEKGEEALPQLREMLACPKLSPGLKTIAAREIGKYHDRSGIPLLAKIVLEICDPDANSDFGARTSASALRFQAARALSAMEVKGIAEQIWEKWRELPPPRQEEVPRLLSELGLPSVQSRHLEMLESSPRDSVAFQVVVELRRVGTSSAVPALQKKIEEWRRKLPAEVPEREKLFYSNMLRYAESTIRILKRRPLAD